MSGLVLASASLARQEMLRNAGLEFDVSVADIDERAVIAAVDPEGEMPPTDVAEILAQ